MTKQIYKPFIAPSAIPAPESALPTDAPIAVYYRQSTDAQVGNVSTAIQTVDMVEYLKQRGWSGDDIYMVDMDAGVSGTKRIDERPGMRHLFELITECKIRAVACQDEDRLFRDVTQIQVNIFIEACRIAHVLVLTPSMVYDFANEHVGQFHARQFRFKCEMAAEYINAYIRGRLHRAKRRLAMEGRWVGGSIPPGFMVDTRKVLPNGSSNENWRRYALFEPYADIINEYFRLFVSSGGCIETTLRRIRKEGIAYPAPETCKPPEGFNVYYGIQKRGSGYYPGRSAIRVILTNAAYLGHWCVNGAIVRWNNHPAIVPEKLFMLAFNYLSEYSLDGSKNPHYRPYKQFNRPSLEEDRPVERPLCAGMMVSEIDGKRINVGTEYVKRDKHYKYILNTSDDYDVYVWSKNAEWVDDAIVKLLHEKLRVTFGSSVWARMLATYEDKYEREHKLKLAQLTAHEEAKKNLIESLETLTLPQMIRGAQERYKQVEEESVRLRAELEASENESRRLEIIRELKDTYEPAIEKWSRFTREEKRVALEVFVDYVEAIPVGKRNTIQFIIHWRDKRYCSVTLGQKAAIGTQWTFDEAEFLLSQLDEGASQVEIAAAFPDRVWRVIGDKIKNLRDRKSATFTPKPIRDFESYDQFIARTRGRAKSQDLARHTWRKNELEQLLELLDRGATKVELAQTFPYRKWTHIRTKVSKLKGHDFEIPGDNPMHHKETYMMYQERLAKERGEIFESHDMNMTTDVSHGRGHPILRRGSGCRADRCCSRHSG